MKFPRPVNLKKIDLSEDLYITYTLKNALETKIFFNRDSKNETISCQSGI